jgi:hypothetical protein
VPPAEKAAVAAINPRRVRGRRGGVVVSYEIRIEFFREGVPKDGDEAYVGAVRRKVTGVALPRVGEGLFGVGPWVSNSLPPKLVI